MDDDMTLTDLLPDGAEPDDVFAAFTAAGFRDSAGVVSPNVYWWRPSGLRRISTLTPDGPRIEVDTELQSVLETLTAR